MKIALDTMGGDSAPVSIIEGARIALKEIPDFFPVLVGNAKFIEAELRKARFPRQKVEIVHASQVVTMSDPPTAALKAKKDSSISIAVTLHRMGKVQAVIGAGNTGAQVAVSMVRLGRVEGVLRPVIGSLFPTSSGQVMLLDVGANPDCRAIHLLQFGIMGAIYMEIIQGIENPRVGLLSIGAEQNKGNEVSLFAYHLFRESHLNFVGNIEGSDLLAGKVDVAVCDGFVGNLILKFAESFPRFLLSQVKSKLAAQECDDFERFLAEKFNPDFYGGVPILGIKGVSVVCHGSASPRAIASGIKVAAEMVNRNINDLVAEKLSEIHRFYEMNRYFINLRRRFENRRERLFWSPGKFFNWFSEKDREE